MLADPEGVSQSQCEMAPSKSLIKVFSRCEDGFSKNLIRDRNVVDRNGGL